MFLPGEYHLQIAMLHKPELWETSLEKKMGLKRGFLKECFEYDENGMICEGLNGRILEVTADGEIVWEYISPWFGKHPTGPSNAVFRAYRYSIDSPEIAGRISYAV